MDFLASIQLSMVTGPNPRRRSRWGRRLDGQVHRRARYRCQGSQSLRTRHAFNKPDNQRRTLLSDPPSPGCARPFVDVQRAVQARGRRNATFSEELPLSVNLFWRAVPQRGSQAFTFFRWRLQAADEDILSFRRSPSVSFGIWVLTTNELGPSRLRPGPMTGTYALTIAPSFDSGLRVRKRNVRELYDDVRAINKCCLVPTLSLEPP